MYKIQIDQSLCSGFGTCAELAPEIFEVEEHCDRPPRRVGRPRCARPRPRAPWPQLVSQQEAA